MHYTLQWYAAPTEGRRVAGVATTPRRLLCRTSKLTHFMSESSTANKSYIVANHVHRKSREFYDKIQSFTEQKSETQYSLRPIRSQRTTFCNRFHLTVHSSIILSFKQSDHTNTVKTEETTLQGCILNCVSGHNISHVSNLSCVDYCWLPRRKSLVWGKTQMHLGVGSHKAGWQHGWKSLSWVDIPDPRMCPQMATAFVAHQSKLGNPPNDLSDQKKGYWVDSDKFKKNPACMPLLIQTSWNHRVAFFTTSSWVGAPSGREPSGKPFSSRGRAKVILILTPIFRLIQESSLLLSWYSSSFYHFIRHCYR